jgi:hypothetical protein
VSKFLQNAVPKRAKSVAISVFGKQFLEPRLGNQQKVVEGLLFLQHGLLAIYGAMKVDQRSLDIAIKFISNGIVSKWKQMKWPVLHLGLR